MSRSNGNPIWLWIGCGQVRRLLYAASGKFVRVIGMGWIGATTILAAVGIGWARERWMLRSSRRLLPSQLATAALAYFFLLGSLGWWIRMTPVGAGLVLAYLGAAVLE